MVLALGGQADFTRRVREGWVHYANENGVRNALEGVCGYCSMGEGCSEVRPD